MKPCEQKAIDEYLKRQEETASHYCKLFADKVPLNICALRKRELNERGPFTCAGCNKGTP